MNTRQGSTLMRCLLAAFLCAAMASAASLNIGDFESGTLSGWTTFTTPSGTIGTPAVVPFDTNGNSTASNAARFNAGRADYVEPGLQGGGIYRDVNLSAGNWTLTADIASEQVYEGGNAGGGFFELLFDGVLVDSHDFGPIDGQTVERAMLSALLNGVLPGSHEVRIQITRDFTTNENTPYQYLDDVILSTEGDLDPVVPEPGAIFLLGAGLAALVIGKRALRR